jgi:uncharacterized FlgJ-related protein
MPLKDMLQSHFDANERATAISLFNQLRALLEPKLIQINPDDRRRYGSVSEENKKIINKVRDLIEQDPVNVPTEVDWVEFEADYIDRRFLESMRSMMAALLSEIQSTKIIHDFDNYHDALVYYHNQVYRMNSGASNAEGKVKELKQFFNSSTKKGSTSKKDDDTSKKDVNTSAIDD